MQSRGVTIAETLVEPDEDGLVSLLVALGGIEPVGVCEEVDPEAMCECPTVGAVHENPGQVRPELDTVLGLEQSKLSGEQQAALRALIGEFSDVFAMDNFELGCTEEVMHSIDTRDQPPVRQRGSRLL